MPNVPEIAEFCREGKLQEKSRKGAATQTWSRSAPRRKMTGAVKWKSRLLFWTPHQKRIKGCRPKIQHAWTASAPKHVGLDSVDQLKCPIAPRASIKRNKAGFSAGFSPMQHTSGSLREHQTDTGSPTFSPCEALRRVAVDQASMVSLRDL